MFRCKFGNTIPDIDVNFGIEKKAVSLEIGLLR